MTKDNTTTFPWKIAIALGVVTVLFLALRFVALDNDPPLYFVKHGQSLLTDPYHLTHHARQQALFDNSNLFEIHRWDNFKNSLVSLTAYVSFTALGVSRSSANFAATLLSVAGILLFSLGIYRRRGQQEALLTALLLSLNNLLFFYGRVPLLENGLIFISGALFYIYLNYGRSIAGQIACGVLIALATLAGKLFGALLLAPVACALLYEYRGKVLLPALYLVGGAIAGSGLYALLFYGGDMSQVFSYYREQTTGMYGSPPGFGSPLNFFKMLFTYGGESGFAQYQPILIALAGLSLIMVSVTGPVKLRYDERFTPVLFCAGWLLAVIVGLSPFLYRPMRYSLFLTLPAGAISAYLIAQLLSKRIRLQSIHRWLTPVLIFGVLTYLFTQGSLYFSAEFGKFAAGVDSLAGAAVSAAIIAGLAGWYFSRARNLNVPPIGLIVIGLFALGLGYNHLPRIYDGLMKPGKLLEVYNNDLSEIISSDAVITGPYAPALTIDTKLKTVIYMFGLSNVDSSLFEDYPITHIAVELGNWNAALKDFPHLKDAQLIAEMVVRDQGVRLYRIADSSFEATEFERAVGLLNDEQPDSAMVLLGTFLQKYPNNLFARLSMITSTLGSGDKVTTPKLLANLVTDFSKNYYALAYAMNMYRLLAQITGEQRYFQIVEALRVRVKELNPYMPAAKVIKAGA